MTEKSITFQMAGGKSITIATGKIAKLANGSCTVRSGDTVVLSTACTGPAREGSDFFPLQVDYREKYSAAGMFPGGYIKREGRPSDREILICRMADRPIRPLFPKGYFDEVQICSLLLSADKENDPDVLSILGASAALTISDLPFNGPIGALRVGLIDGEFVANPTTDEMKRSKLELIYAGLADKVIMIEGDAKEINEETLKGAMEFANEQVKIQIEAQLQLAEQAGKTKITPKLYLVPEDLMNEVKSFCNGKLDTACFIVGKEERNNALKVIAAELKTVIADKFAGKYEESDLKFKLQIAYDEVVMETVRQAILKEGKRADGRKINELRSISGEVGILPRTHGTGLFNRGETQGLVVTTLGSPKDEQITDSITTRERTLSRKFYLHYNFPNYSVGEVGKISGPGRREIGHGNLAERSLAQIIPEDYPYTVRCISEIMGSNGSTSMASICGGSLSLMDAGVPIKGHVAGISCGLVKEGNDTVILTDILGSEDHYGDMDFKVAGTQYGITGFQLDLKIPGISIALLYDAMLQNKVARSQIHEILSSIISAPREEMSPYAPRIHIIKINPDKIGALIGPGGKNIKQITESSGAEINIEDDGTVSIFATNKDSLEDALYSVNSIAAEVEQGKIYRGTVVAIKDFGVFVELFPGQDGFVHISELADYRVEKVTDVCQKGDKMSVKVVGVDNRGKIRLSRKAALAEIN